MRPLSDNYGDTLGTSSEHIIALFCTTPRARNYQGSSLTLPGFSHGHAIAMAMPCPAAVPVFMHLPWPVALLFAKFG